MPQQTLTYSRVVDLSHTIDTRIPLWPGDPPVEIQTIARRDTEGYHLRRFTLGEHSATHMNAPNSFLAGGVGIDAYAPESLVVNAVVIDIRSTAQQNPDHALTEQDVLDWERDHGTIPPGSVVLLYTGWQEKWDDSVAFLGQDAGGGLHFPGFAGSTTRFLLDHRGIAGVGVDTHGADAGQDATHATNTQVLERRGIVLECLTRLDQLPPIGTTLVLGILRLRDGSGSPLSVMAFVP
ncbi:MAG TPA: cyclase family protein [Candidatus Nanopelagicales bacterium]|nr:cyclase family protein [Candidatus Nanopelagicales bacterium]